MRVVVLCTALLLACKGSSAPTPPAAYRFLPAAPDLVVRLDLVRARAWPLFDKAATVALHGVEQLRATARERCKLDVIGEASTVVVARRGVLLAGDLTVIATGLDRARVTACLQTVASATLQVAIDEELVDVQVAGRSIASAAFLPSGELVVVARNGAGVAAEAWKAEVRQGIASIPAYVAELDLRAAVAIRIADDQRTIRASTQLGDPLTVTAKVISSSEKGAKDDEHRMRAILSYLSQGDAGAGNLQPTGLTIDAYFTAKGAQADHLLAIALPALVGADEPKRDVAADATDAPGDCAPLDDAVTRYIAESMAKAPPERRTDLEKVVATLVPALQKAFAESCTSGRWMASAVTCHVTHATDLARFERCREVLTRDQRATLDQAVAAALAGK